MVGTHPWTLVGGVTRPWTRVSWDDGSTQGYVCVRAGTAGATDTLGRVTVVGGTAGPGRTTLAAMDGTATLTSMVRVTVSGGAVTVTVGVDDIGTGLGVAVAWAAGGAGVGDVGAGLGGGVGVAVSVTAGACVVLDGAVLVGSVGLGAFVAVVELVELVELVDGVGVAVGSEGAGWVGGDVVGSVGAGEVVSVEAGAGVAAVLGSGATVSELLGVVQVGPRATDGPWLAEEQGLGVSGSAWAMAAAAGAVTNPAMTTASRT